MDMRRLLTRQWLVLLIAVAAAVSSLVWFDVEVHELDPRVGQAIVAEVHAAHKYFQPLFGEAR